VSLATAAAVALAVTFAASAVAKLWRRPDMAELGLPRWSGAALAALELALAALLLLAPSAGGIASLAVLSGFTTFLARRVGTGRGCACFGSTAAPARWWHLARNAVLLLLAGLAGFG